MAFMINHSPYKPMVTHALVLTFQKESFIMAMILSIFMQSPLEFLSALPALPMHQTAIARTPESSSDNNLSITGNAGSINGSPMIPRLLRDDSRTSLSESLRPSIRALIVHSEGVKSKLDGSTKLSHAIGNSANICYKKNTFDLFIFEMVLIDIRIVLEKLLLFDTQPTFEYDQKIPLADQQPASFCACPIFLALAEIRTGGIPDVVAQAARAEMF
jgi:hypothetical protein